MSVRRKAIEIAGAIAAQFGLAVEPSHQRLSEHRKAALKAHGVGLVVDVGANAGQYASGLRRAGYRGRIHSFEPQPRAATRLRRLSASDPLWDVTEVALGASVGRLPMFVTDDSQSTSLLAPVRRAGSFGFLAGAWGGEAEVRTLDEFELWKSEPALMIKMDIQGFEAAVISGAPTSFSRAVAVECEMSLVPVYEGQPLIEEVMLQLRQLGFTPIALTRGYTDPTTHHVVQVDGIFVRG
jgi:FkbM family methyltransferase